MATRLMLHKAAQNLIHCALLTFVPLTVACATPTRPGVTGQATAADVVAQWQSGQPVRVLVLGNSISMGYYADGWERIVETAEGRGTAASQADPAIHGVIHQLRRFIMTRNPASVVVNASRGGETAHGALLRLDQVLAPGTVYDLAFVALTVNDANQGNTPGEYMERMDGLIARLKAANIVPVLVKENDIWKLSEQRFGIPYSAFIAAVDQLASKHGLSVVDGYTPFRDAIVAGGGIEASGLFWPFDDYAMGLHPSQAGHNILAKAYERWFMSAVKR